MEVITSTANHHCASVAEPVKNRPLVLIIGPYSSGERLSDDYSVVEINNAARAVVVAEVEPIKAIVIDTRAAGAWIACRLLARKFRATLSIIVMTNDDITSTRHALAAGASHVVGFEAVGIREALALTVGR